MMPVTRTSIEQRLAALREEGQRADEELNKLRPRVLYLQEMLLRLEGAIGTLTQLLEEEQKAAGQAVNSTTAQPVGA
jgi:predicted  nucleic acid-binding Zn-ribbon protein